MLNHDAQQGFLTFAQNTKNTNYLDLAYLQALNIKTTQKNNLYAVIVDADTAEQLEQKHIDTFDYIIELGEDYSDPNGEWKLDNEFQAFWLTPFKETIKLESDLLFTRSIDHWWQAFRLRDICLSTGCRDYLQDLSTVRSYRNFIDTNSLPDVYSGLMYFRYSEKSLEFFSKARWVQFNWQKLRQFALKNCYETRPSTDHLYAVTADLVGRENCTIPTMDFLNFVHMKSAINGFIEEYKFSEVFLTELDDGMIRINNINQYHPLHYHDKTFATEDLIEYYERSRIS
jgi:hypothetical protein